MVPGCPDPVSRLNGLSVLALSSRFDGRPQAQGKRNSNVAFSTRSVESF